MRDSLELNTDETRKLPLVRKAGAKSMTHDDRTYHRERERHCRTMAELAEDPDVRRRHEELASLHADRAALPHDFSAFEGGLRAI